MKLPLAGGAAEAIEATPDIAALEDARRRSRTTRHLTQDEMLALARADGHEPVVPGDVPGGKSVCLCDHLGDGSKSEHAGLIGHGYCAVPGCHCPKFSWRRFIWEKK
jgi:hypothetical protein